MTGFPFARRGLVRGLVALPLGGGAALAGPLDADLHALGLEHCALSRALRALTEDELDDDLLRGPISRRQWEIEDALAERRARGLPGLWAKAQALRVYLADAHGELAEADAENPQDRLTWSMILDVEAMAAGGAA